MNSKIPAYGLTGIFLLWLLTELIRGGIPWTPMFGLALALIWALSIRNEGRLWTSNAATAVFLAVLAAYLSTFRWHGGDDAPNSLIPFCLLRHGTLALDPVIDPWFIGKTHDFTRLFGTHRLSVFPVLPGLMAIPVYLIPIFSGVIPDERFLHNLSKISGSLIVAASVAIFYKAVRKRCSHEWALCLTLLYGLGSWAFSVSSQSLWQHGPAVLGIALALRGLNEKGFWSDVIIGLGAAGSVAARPDSIFFAVALGAYILFHERSRLAGLILGIIPPAALLTGYWLYYTGHLSPPESSLQSALFTHFQREAFIGILLSPTRGLLFFFPAALFGVWAGLKRVREPLIAWLSLACFGPLFLMSFYSYWVGGNTYGPRYFAVAALVWCYFMADAKIEKEIRSHPVKLGAWVSIALFCFLVHALGGYMTWPGDQAIEAEKANVWRWNLHPILFFFSSEGWLHALPMIARLAIGFVILGLGLRLGLQIRRRLALR